MFVYGPLLELQFKKENLSRQQIQTLLIGTKCSAVLNECAHSYPLFEIFVIQPSLTISIGSNYRASMQFGQLTPAGNNINIKELAFDVSENEILKKFALTSINEIINEMIITRLAIMTNNDYHIKDLENSPLLLSTLNIITKRIDKVAIFRENTVVTKNGVFESIGDNKWKRAVNETLVAKKPKR